MPEVVFFYGHYSLTWFFAFELTGLVTSLWWTGITDIDGMPYIPRLNYIKK